MKNSNLFNIPAIATANTWEYDEFRSADITAGERSTSRGAKEATFGLVGLEKRVLLVFGVDGVEPDPLRFSLSVSLINPK